MLLMYLARVSVNAPVESHDACLLVEERLKHNDLVARLDEGHESAQHAWKAVSKLKATTFKG
jgi:hypothetical protein